MTYNIENAFLKVSVDAFGAQLASIRSKKTGTEYLWQGNETYWKGRAYNLFPIIGRLYRGVYRYEHIDYVLPTHGFARHKKFTLHSRTATKLVLSLSQDEETMEGFPFLFTLLITFALEGNKLVCSYTVKNDDNVEMVFALGGHPGFNVPFDGGTFEDYYLEFAQKTQMAWYTLADTKLMSGKARMFPLENGVKLPLEHSLFDDDAIILSNTCRKVSLKSNCSQRQLLFDYPDFKFLGLWHTPQSDAPFLCLEPWSALPSTEGVLDDFATKLDMTHLAKGKTHTATWSVTIEE